MRAAHILAAMAPKASAPQGTSCLALLLLVATFGCANAAPASPLAVATPLFAWASTPSLFKEDLALQAEAVPDFAHVLNGLVSGAASGAAAAGSIAARVLDASALSSAGGGRPDVVLVVLGSQLKSSDLRRRAGAPLLRPLQQLLQGARSSLALPYMLHEASGADAGELERGLEAAARGAGAGFNSVGCDGVTWVADDVQRAAQQQQGRSAVLLVCAAEAPAIGGDAAIAAELEQLIAAHAAVASPQRGVLALYAVRPPLGAFAPARRTLTAVASANGYATCDALCQTQVQWLQGIFAGAILLFAALAGMSCLYLLDTPTRFESPKDLTRND